MPSASQLRSQALRTAIWISSCDWLLRDLDRNRLKGEVREACCRRQAAEWRAFRAQVNSHFLSNTLHTIRSMIRSDTEEARDALNKLAELFRFTFG